jgi:hypothetical protein
MTPAGYTMRTGTKVGTWESDEVESEDDEEEEEEEDEE